MFIIPTLTGPSAIHGLGVFAARDISKDEIVWVFDAAVDIIIPDAEFERLSGKLKEFFEFYCYDDKILAPSGCIYCSDNGKFVNHSLDPNVIAIGHKQTALRDIKSGEEITCDYRIFDWGSPESVPDFVRGSS
jgi:SET domain-containing protein